MASDGVSMPGSQTRVNLEALQNSFINPAYLTAGPLADLRTWFGARPRQPKVFVDFLLPAVAEDLSAALKDVPVWSRCATIYRGNNEPEVVDPITWLRDPERAANHLVARPLVPCFEPGAWAPKHQSNLGRFLDFAILSGALHSWFVAGIGCVLDQRTSVELACYERGDEIRSHQDLVPGRFLAINFYLDDEYRTAADGRLGFQNEQGEVFHVAPLFNTMSVIPIDEDCFHWVESFEADRRGRYTISVGLHSIGRHRQGDGIRN